MNKVKTVDAIDQIQRGSIISNTPV